MSAEHERPSGRKWAWGIASRGLAAATLWWAVAVTWFYWVTTILIVFALFSTGLLALMLWALSRDRYRRA